MYSSRFRSHTPTAAALAAHIAQRCDTAQQTSRGWLASCPAHDDHHPSLAITPAADRVLVMCYAGCDNTAIVAALGLTMADLFVSRRRSLPALGPRARAPITITSIPDAPARRARLKEIWRQSRSIRPGDPVGRYLTRRGLWHEPMPSTLRYHPHLPYHHDDDTYTYHPALVAAIQAPNDTVVTLHRIYLATNGQKAAVPTPKKFMRSLSTLRGAAARLDRAGARLIITEGIETGLAVRKTTGWPTWAALSAGGIETLVVPHVVELVVIAADHDKSGVGQGAARTLAERIMRQGRRVKILIPETPGTDWADGVQEVYGA